MEEVELRGRRRRNSGGTWHEDSGDLRGDRIMAARSADITVTRIWLRTYSPKLDGVVRRGCCVGIPVETGDVLSDAMWAAIAHCALLFVDGPVPDELNCRGLWNLPRLEAVMATAGTRTNPSLTHKFSKRHSKKRVRPSVVSRTFPTASSRGFHHGGS